MTAAKWQYQFQLQVGCFLFQLVDLKLQLCHIIPVKLLLSLQTQLYHQQQHKLKLQKLTINHVINH